jgi:UDP-GlcNAc:undecaprenyl-phosphate GlcNAc-1-phosphate transferase
MAKSSLIIFLLTPLLTLLLRKLALRFNLVDLPNTRKIHRKPIPLIGGIALVISSGIALALLGGVSEFALYLYVSACLVAGVGLMDDVVDLSALVRFAVQIAASLFIVFMTKVQLFSFGYLLLPSWQMSLGLLSIPITVFGVVGVINALNMSDGIDGLAAMTFLLPTLTLALLSFGTGLSNWLLLLLIAVAVFVVFNKSNKFKLFLGDNGSMFLGFILAWLLVYYSQNPVALIKPVTALYLVAIPIYDTIFVMLRRFTKGVSPFKPDKTHLHHLFLSRGFSQSKTLVLILSMHALMIVFGVFIINQWQEIIQFYLFVLFSIIYYYTLKKIWEKSEHS